ncbi:MAG: family 43 glycosylhydrolase [Defluviitaleaceae bacterium]|nr:family 43 glycosylhydrolase [Defluviitaleaceae bacterium]
MTAVDDDGRDRPNEWGWFFHHPFEGSTHGWQPRGGTTVEPSGRTFALGAESLAIRNRSATWHGASFDLTPRAFRAGETFSFSVCAVYLEGGGAEEELSLTLEHTVGGETRWVNIARGFADRGEWVQLANRSFAIPAGATNLRLVVESPTNADITFYIDEAIGAVSNTNIAAPSGVNQPRPERRPTITPTPTPTPTPTLTPTPTPDDLAQIFASITPAPALISATNNNPIMTQRFSADPNAMVYNDRVYVFSTNDVIERDGQGNIVSNTFMNINTINLISSADMVNWTDHGAIRAAGSGGAATFASQSWAPSAVHKNISGQDRFFLYFCNNASGIVVLTAPTPIGPWTSPRNNMLINNSTPGVNRDEIPWLFDPAVFVDDDGQGYLYFGGGIPGGNNPTAEQFRNPRSARVIRLSDDMINTQSSAVMIDAPFMFEASEMFKHGDTYYFSYSTNFAPQLPVDGFEAASIRYMTSSSPMGPFTYRGTVLPRLGHTLGQWGNSHHDIIEFRGQHYIFYHSADLVYARYGTRDFGYRSTHVDILNINPDGTIQQVTPTRTGVPQIGTLNPYETVRASTIARQAGINVRGVGDTVVTDIDRGDWISVRGAGFTSGAESVTVRVSSVDGAAIRIARGDPQGQLVGFVEVPVTGSAFVDITVPVTVPVGTHDLYFLFSGSMEFESWMFGNDGSGVIEWPDRPPAPSTINGTNILTLTAATIIGGEAGPIINADPLPTRDGASVVFEQRAADWNGLDIRTGEPNNLRAGDEIVISGRISNHPVPAGTQMIMIQAGGNWTMLAQANATLSAPFELRHILRESDIAADVNFRIQTNAAGAEIPFVIDHILITRPIPAVCGVDGYVCNLPECELCNPDCGNCGSYPCKCIRVTFNLNGGTFANPENATRIITPGDNISTLPRATASVFSLEGYRFIGWFRDTADESTRWRDNNEVNGGVTLYAKWVVTPHDFVLGNVNHDGRITSADATAIARYLAEHNVEDICLLAADLNGDGDVCIADVILLARWLVGHDVSHLLAH